VLAILANAPDQTGHELERQEEARGVAKPRIL